MRLLVAGNDRVDAGKTTFSTGLIDRVDGIGFKPRAGNDHWFDHDDYRTAVDDGRLYGKDAARLAAASAADLAPEDVNPVHRLWRPSPGASVGILGQERRTFVLDRVESSYVVNETASVPAEARERLPLDDATGVSTLAEFNEVMERLHLPALDRLADEITETEPCVVESYGNVARPIRDVSFDAVAVVEPERARVYDGDRYAKACAVAGGSAEGQLEERVPEVVEFVEPLATERLPALTGDERDDPSAVAAAYEPAYDALIDAAQAD